MKKDQDTLTVVMPVYNEEGIIETVVKNWYKTLDALNIDFVIRCYNDGSSDGTLEILNELVNSLPRLKVKHKVNTGHGPTIYQGYLDAVTSDWIFQVDSDNEIGADQFEKLWHIKEDFDFLLGRRSHGNFPLSRRIISYFARNFVRIGFGSKGTSDSNIEDVNSPFRLFRSKRIVPLIRLIPIDTFAPNILISGLVVANDLRIVEVDIVNVNRLTGTVSIRNLRLLRVAIQSFVESLSFVIEYRKMRSHESF